MHAKDAITAVLDAGQRILEKYVIDVEDSELTVPPAEGIHSVAWQLGHLIAGERRMIEGVKPGSSPALPDGFEEVHAREAVTSGPGKFLPTADYLKLYQTQRDATKAALASLSDAELDAPGPERMRAMAPTVGSVFVLAGCHQLMHVGQFVPLRRKLGKPVVI